MSCKDNSIYTSNCFPNSSWAQSLPDSSRIWILIPDMDFVPNMNLVPDMNLIPNMNLVLKWILFRIWISSRTRTSSGTRISSRTWISNHVQTLRSSPLCIIAHLSIAHASFGDHRGNSYISWTPLHVISKSSWIFHRLSQYASTHSVTCPGFLGQKSCAQSMSVKKD